MAGGLGSRMQNFLLEVTKGNVAGHYPVNVFGRNIDIDSIAIADIWDGGHTGDVSLIWVAPTQARVHNLISSSTSDDGDPAGVGARTVEVLYLPDWDTKEASVVVTMNGTTNVVLPSLVMINKMEVITKGGTNSNVGVIKATAVTDNTITAKIRVGQGRTQQAILGIPSSQTFYIGRLYANSNKGGGAAGLIDMSLLCNPEADSELKNFNVFHPFALAEGGTSALTISFYVPKIVAGAAIIKIQGLSGSANMDVNAGFDGILVDNTIGAL